MPSIDPTMSQEAVELLKHGSEPAAVYERLVARGATHDDAQGYVHQLLELKRQAEAADPARMRAEATSMLQRGASPAQVAQTFTARGIPVAEADIARLAATVRPLVPCQRCRQMMDPGQAYFDSMGNQVCSNCHDRDQISQGDQRVEDRRLEDAGVSAYALQQNHAVVWCPRCKDQTGVLHSATHYLGNTDRSDVRHFTCTRCGHAIS
jgi:DNA-directed RNA polymerase subunit M/transcription elongation factor TFIIS